jgi:hypothetical protein
MGRKESAKEKTKVSFERKLALKEILETHNVKMFRSFFETTNEVPGLVDMDDMRLNILMHEFKAKLPYMGKHFHDSRRILRLAEWAPSDLAARFPDGEYPICGRCKWFREVPPDDTTGRACMHLGAVPEDMVCQGFVPVE